MSVRGEEQIRVADSETGITSPKQNGVFPIGTSPSNKLGASFTSKRAGLSVTPSGVPMANGVGGNTMQGKHDEEDEFEFLLQESFERKQKKQGAAVGSNKAVFPEVERGSGGQRNIHRIIEEPHQTTEYDVDDLIDELNGGTGKKKKAAAAAGDQSVLSKQGGMPQ